MSSEILQCLAASLNPDANARITAELRIKDLLPNPGMLVAASATHLS